jgi:hypothetical protein
MHRPLLVLTAISLVLAGAAPAQYSLTTTYAGGNGQSGNMFDLVAHGGAAVTVLTLDGHLNAGVNNVEIWTRPGSYVGFTGSSSGWTQVGTASVTSLGTGVGTPIPIPVNVTIPAGATQAFYLHSSAGVDYTNGSSLGAVYVQDTFLQILEGHGGTYFALTFQPRVWNGTVHYEVGPSCVINSPGSGATVSGTVPVDYDADHSMGSPVDALFEWSTDTGATWTSCTPASGVNPVLGIATPAPGLIFDWDTAGDALGLVAIQATDLRITVDDGSTTTTCTVDDLQVDNVPPSPTCTITLTSPPPVRWYAAFDWQADSVNGPTVDAAFDFSTDGGATWATCTPMPGHTNPMPGMASGSPYQFEWDSRTDAVAMAAPLAGVLTRITAGDGVAPVPGTCSSLPFTVDNTALCYTHVCGDCDEDGAGPTILDALAAAHLAAGLATPTLLQQGCCDGDSNMAIEILDALLLARASAFLPPTITCP